MFFQRTKNRSKAVQLKAEQAKYAQIEQKLQSSGNPGGAGKVLDDSGALEISGQC